MEFTISFFTGPHCNLHALTVIGGSVRQMDAVYMPPGGTQGHQAKDTLRKNRKAEQNRVEGNIQEDSWPNARANTSWTLARIPPTVTETPVCLWGPQRVNH